MEPAPNHFEPSVVYQEALMEAGVPWTQVEVNSVDSEYERLTEPGVEFSVKPTEVGNVKYTIHNDSFDNHIQLVQEL